MVGQQSSDRYYQFLRKNQETIIIFIIFLLGAILRLLFINTREIAYDDAFSYFLSRGSLQKIIIGTASDTMPPLYYFLLHYWMKICEDLWFLRLLNVLINIVTAGLIYSLTKLTFDKKSAYITILLFLISPFQIYHSQELRMYSILLLGQVGYYLGLIRMIQSKNQNYLWMVVAIISGTIAMYSHNLAFIGLVGINVILFFGKYKKSFSKIFLIQLLILLFSSPWFFYLPQQLTKIQNAFWTQKPGFIDIIQSILTLFSFLPLPTIVLAIVLIIVIQCIILVVIHVFRSKIEIQKLFFILFLIPPIILFIISYLIKPVFVPRIMILCTVFFFILFGKFCAINISKPNGKISLFLFIFVNIVSLPYFYNFQSFPRSSFHELASFVNKMDPNLVVIHDNKLSFFPVMFYEERNNSFYLEDEAGSPNDTLAIKSQEMMGFLASKKIDQFIDLDSLVFIVFQQTVDEYLEVNLEHPVIARLNFIYKNVQINKIGDILVYTYECKQ